MALLYLPVAALGAACFHNALHGEFVHDDVVAIVRNRDVTGEEPLATILRDDFWGTPLSDPRSHKSYRPLTTLTFRLNFWLSGLHPLWFHAVNVLLHVACCVLFTRLALVVARLDARFATVAGLTFATHPIHTEAVAGVVGRADVLATLLFLLSFLIYHDGSWRKKGGSRVGVSCTLAALATLAKETGITVLAVNLIFDLYRSWPPLKRSFIEAQLNDESVRFYKRAIKVIIVTSFLLLLRLAMLQGSMPKFSAQDNPAAAHPSAHVRLLTYTYVALLNGRLLVCPTTLSHDWQMGSVPLVTSISDGRNVATLFCALACLLLALRCAADFETQRHGPLVLGCLLLMVPFLPASNLLFTVGFVVAERVLYIPSLGFSLLVAYGVQLLYRSGGPRQRLGLFFAVLLLTGTFSCQTLQRNRAWDSREALLRAGIKALPHNAKMHYNLGNLLRDSASPDLAARHYREALRLWPGYASAHNNLGTLMNSAEEAEGHFKSAISISPEHVNAHYNLAQVYRKLNRTAEAVRMLEQCLRLDTSYSPAYLVLAQLHSAPIAARLLRHVTRLLPHSADHLAYYADWLYHRGLVQAAQTFYLRALRVQNQHMDSFLGALKCFRSKGHVCRQHQMLIRWYLMHRDSRARGRQVYSSELYVTSSSSHITNQESCATEKERPRKLWANNRTKRSCERASQEPKPNGSNLESSGINLDECSNR